MVKTTLSHPAVVYAKVNCVEGHAKVPLNAVRPMCGRN
jgi:hypothetical protein